MLVLPGIQKNPLVKILFSLLLGILVMHAVPYNYREIVLTLTAVPALLILSYLSIRSIFKQAFPGAVLLIMVMLCGMLLLKQSQDHTQLPDTKLECRALALSLPVKGVNSTRIDCRLISVGNEDEEQEIRERVKIFMPDDSIFQPIQIGDSLYFKARFQAVKNNSNPQSFRYDKYLQNRGIRYTAFINTGEIKRGDYSGKFVLRRKAAMLQSAIVSFFSRYGIEGEELAIVSALIAGERSQIDESIRDTYAIAGAMHILAISGLHVGILYLFLQLLLFKRNELPLFRYSRLVIIVLLLWVYAFIAGLSPSVIRATLMFTLFQFGKSFNRPATSLNILAASALIILALSPLQLFQLGFQFSYLAVLGILIFQPKLESLLEFKRALPDRLWQLVTVSLSVQITTFPLALFYFNQFPAYFLLTNIVIVPFVWMIMFLSIVFFISLPITALAGILATTLSLVLLTMNSLIEWIAVLPFALIPNIRFGIVHLIFWSILILYGMLVNSKMLLMRFFRIAVVTLSVLLLIDIAAYSLQERKDEMVVYNSNQNQIISIIHGHRHLILLEVEDDARLNRDLDNLRKFWLNRQIFGSRTRISLDSLSKGASLSGHKFELENNPGAISFSFAETDFYCLKYKSFNHPQQVIPQKLDALIIDKNSPAPNETFLGDAEIKNLIICNSTKYYNKISWLSYARQQGINYFDIAEEGAYQISRNKEIPSSGNPVSDILPLE